MTNSPTLKFCDAHVTAGFMKKPHTSEPRSESIGKVESVSPELEEGKTVDIAMLHEGSVRSLRGD